MSEERKKVEKVISGEVKLKKKSEIRKRGQLHGGRYV